MVVRKTPVPWRRNCAPTSSTYFGELRKQYEGAHSRTVEPRKALSRRIAAVSSSRPLAGACHEVPPRFPIRPTRSAPGAVAPGDPGFARPTAATLGRATGAGPRGLRPTRAAGPSRLPRVCRPLRRQLAGPCCRTTGLRRRRPKKVEQAHRPLRHGEVRTRCIRLLGGLLLWVSALYCAPSSRPGKGRREH